MKSGKMTNILLALIFLVLLAHLLLPFVGPKEAVAVGPDSVSPALKAAEVDERLAPDKLVTQIADALNEIARSNQKIADAIIQHGHSNERIALSLDKAAAELRSPEKKRGE